MPQHRANQLVEAGLWLRLSGDTDGAARLFDRALQLDPDNGRARDLMAQLQARLAASDDALAGDGPPPAGLEGDWGAWAELSAPESGDPLFVPDAVLLPDGVGAPRDALDLLAQDHRRHEGEPVRMGRDRGSELDVLLRGAEDLLELDDHSGAVDLLRRAQELAPEEPRVEALRDRSERTLIAMLEAKLGDLGRVPRVRLRPDDIIWLNLDHRAGFVLAQIDGTVSYDDLFSLSGMTRLDTARILAQLLDEGVIVAG
ncbi:tetratricopeptide repeat protein [Myxococcaceae bacterium JPH2]|nr:tetratricopeptide repeat protein [Myxococcaceae bacterium JPH2]